MRVFVARPVGPRATRERTQALLVFTRRVKLSEQTRMLSEVAENKATVASNQRPGRGPGKKEVESAAKREREKETLMALKGSLRKKVLVEMLSGGSSTSLTTVTLNAYRRSKGRTAIKSTKNQVVQ